MSTTSAGEIAVPDAGSGAVVVGSADSPGQGFTLGLPAVAAGAQAQVSEDGTVVYGGHGVSVTVQALSTAVRASAVIADASAPTTYTYTFAGLTPRLNADGTVTLSRDAEGVSADVARLDAPWARDAAGAAVPTRYEIVGDSVVQSVDLGEGRYQFPVVADPTIQHDCGIISCTFRFNRAATMNIRDYGNVSGAVLALAAFAIWPAVIAVGSIEWSTWAGRYYGNGNCLGFRDYGVWSTFVEVKRGTYNCS